jgi:hypothetical protein
MLHHVYMVFKVVASPWLSGLGLMRMTWENKGRGRGMVGEV